MLPSDYTNYFTAAATAAGTLIGLLFVAITLRPETIFGDESTLGGRALATSAFTALVNAFFVSLIALMPHQNVGYGAAVMGLLSLVTTLRLRRRFDSRSHYAVTTLISGLTYLGELGIGIGLIADSKNESLLSSLTYILIGGFGVALARAWSLVKGEHVAAPAGGS
jgi:hypothetical protein